MLKEHSLVVLQSLLSEHVQRGGVSELCGLFEQIAGHRFVGLHSEAVSVHVGEVDHGVGVFSVVGLYEILVGFFVGPFDDVGDAVEVDRPEIDHGVGVAHLCGLEVAPHGQLSVLFDPVPAEIAVPDFVLGCSVVALGGFDEVGDCFFC